MINEIQQFIEQKHMFEKNDHVVVGVSGGADSMCLLNVLMRLGKKYNLSLFVVHVNHMIRGAEADSEEEFVRSFCLEHNISVNCIKADVISLAKERGCSVEEAGRIARYDAFEQECKKHNCHKIAIAHNMNDNAETVLFHLLRGSKTEGMSGIKAVNHKIVRPLLETSRKSIEQFLVEEKINYCTDSSNLSLDYTRNKIRNRLLPFAVNEINDKSMEHIVSFAKEMEQISEYLKKQTAKLYSKAAIVSADRVELEIEQLSKMEPILQQSVIKHAIEMVSQNKKDIEEKHIQSAVQLLSKQSGKMISLPYHIIVLRGYTTLIVKKKEEQEKGRDLEYKAVIPGAVLVPENNYEFHFEVIKPTANMTIPKNSYTKWFDYDKIKDTIVLRTRQQGDFLQIHKDGGNKSVKSLLIDGKVPKEQRDSYFFLASGHHVLWLPKLRTSEAFLIDETTTRILSVTLVLTTDELNRYKF